MKILYVEDNEDNVYVVKSRLTRAGYTVLVAPDVCLLTLCVAVRGGELAFVVPAGVLVVGHLGPRPLLRLPGEPERDSGRSPHPASGESRGPSPRDPERPLEHPAGPPERPEQNHSGSR